MSEIIERFERVGGRFTDRVRGVPADAWDNPSPCEGWTARDVVGHVTLWIPQFFGAQGVDFPAVPSVEEDPVGAWETVHATIAAALTDPAISAKPVETPFSTQSLAETVDMIVTGDVFTHTWDLARATGQDESLDPDQLRRMISAVGSMPEEVMRADGMFGPQIDVAEDADDQTKFLGYVGRRS
ncbi:MAG TPA: TIGR03086 family metal-binding protein [Acidimicrobiales bacterium]|nr:TIGR03086 family metal-binding protein [Acidimicrobiales bacterium]